jgi:dihydroxy-acid dehydratase
LADVIHRDALTVNGKTMGENTADAPCWNREVIHERVNPIRERAGLAVVRGNLAPNGAVIKPSAATPSLLKHRGRAVVFESIEDFKARIDQPDLEIDETSVMVLKGAGPKGYPGMPEVGNMPLPPKLLARGITDLVRISDARMSGTAYGTVVLHVSPESAAGGPLAVVENGDEIELDIDSRKLELRVSDDELNRRKAAWKPAPVTWTGGYQRLYIDHVLQADQGADLDFLVGCRGAGIPRESH